MFSLTNSIKQYIITNGTALERLPFGAIRYGVHDMSCVVDSNCMGEMEEKSITDTIKYLILRPDCKVYTRWDNKSSLLF